MKRMHETDGTKNYYQNYNHYPNHHQHFNSYTNNNNNSGGYQQMNNGYHHNNNNPNGYHNNYRNNYGYNRRPNHRYNKYSHHNNNHHAHQQYNNNNNNSNHQQPPFHCQIPQPAMGQMPDMPTTLLPTSQVMDENSNSSVQPSQQQQQPVVVSCLTPEPPGSSSSSSKTTPKNSEIKPSSHGKESIEDPLPLSQSQTNTPAATVSSATVVVPPPTSSSFGPDTSIDVVRQKMLTLSEAIWKKFILNQQPPDIFAKKMTLWKELYELFKTTHGVQYPRYMLQVVGSTMSGFGSRTSDVDVCLMIRKSEVDQRIEAVDRLHELQASLQQIPHMEKIELIYAKVPILKFRDSSRGLDVDLNCNNSVGIRNTHLQYCYSQLDWRVKPLVLVIKLWAQFHGINDAKNMTISSYSLVLMVIHYLQFGCKEPVLPCLHQMYPEKFSPFNDVEKIKINEQIPKWDSQNQEGLGELLTGFLEYYSRKFDYARAAVSVRLGCHVPIKICMQARSFKNDPHQWKYLCVEEPFDLTNTARSVYDKEAFDRIRGVFYASWNRLIVTRDLTSIFYAIEDKESRAVAGRMPSVVLR